MNTVPALMVVVILIVSIPIAAGMGLRSDLYENFEGVTPPGLPVGWSSLNANGDTGFWETKDFGGYQGEPVSIRHRQDPLNVADDWFFTSGVSLASGIAYELRFVYRVSNAAAPHAMTVFAGNAQTPGSMSTVIWSDPAMISTDHVEVSAGFTVPASATYYLGFHAESPPGIYRLFVDDINLLGPEEDLELHLGLTQEFYQTGMLTYDLGDSIISMTYVYNNGPATVVLNSAFAVGGRIKVTQLGFVITDPFGQTLDRLPLFERMGPLEPQHFSALEPDSVAGKFLDLYEWYDFQAPGEHTIEAYYRNYADPFGLGAWMGELRSDPVVILIE